MVVASDIMSEDVSVIYEDMLIHQVAHLLLRARISGFPVVNKKIGVVGIITITDLFRLVDEAAVGRGDDELYRGITEFKDLPVGQVMSREVVSIQGNTPLVDIIHLVVEKDIHTFPVMDEGKLVGIVSRHDILNAIFSYLFKEGEGS